MPISKNLKPVRNKTEATELGRRGGIASGVTRKEKKTLSEVLLAQIMKRRPDGRETGEHLAEALILSAISGDVRAMAPIFGLYRLNAFKRA